VTGSEPTVSVTSRSAGVAFAVTVTLILASPDPDVGFTLTHGAGDPAVHAHSLCVRISIVVLSPAALSGPAGPETSYSHGAAS
jgi:hypothetical protein